MEFEYPNIFSTGRNPILHLHVVACVIWKLCLLSKGQNTDSKIPSSSDNDNESLETISLENESFISLNSSVKSLTEALNKLGVSFKSIKSNVDKIVESVTDKIKNVPGFENEYKNFIAEEKNKKLDKFLGYSEL
ncbi:hypothetical protein RCL_jg7213.t1 [Rhizophagus clarus]|uniref:Uncharacterized protein n=1 Tax=Rhizophagus clarus TaxID=94130 RepID=A0A8H3M6C5_9GLOM|nr:hypothetical protein RCL_jg7213.t1 [Rhizophagus clarus]